MKPRLRLLVTVLLLAACSVRVYDLQPLVRVTETKDFSTPTPFLARTKGPSTVKVTNTPPVHIAPTAIQQTSPIQILELSMIDGGIGWAVGRMPGSTDKLIVRTVDGGTNWKNVTPSKIIYDYAGMDVETSAYFTGANHACVLIWKRNKWNPQEGITVWFTVDGGANWNSSHLPVSGYTISYFNDPKIGFIDEKIGWIMAKLGAHSDREYIGLYTTHDGGASWSVPVNSDSANLSALGKKNGAVFINAIDGWISGSNSHDEPSAMLWRTYDGGNTWYPLTIPLPAGEQVPADLFSSGNYECSLTVPKFVDFQHQYAWSVLRCRGNGLGEPLEALYWTLDAGASWRSYPFPHSLIDPVFFGFDKGWIVQRLPDTEDFDYAILYTADSGQTWNPVAKTMWSIVPQFITPVVGFGVAGYNGDLYLMRSDTGGYAWEQIGAVINP